MGQHISPNQKLINLLAASIELDPLLEDPNFGKWLGNPEFLFWDLVVGCPLENIDFHLFGAPPRLFRFSPPGNPATCSAPPSFSPPPPPRAPRPSCRLSSGSGEGRGRRRGSASRARPQSSAEARPRRSSSQAPRKPQTSDPRPPRQTNKQTNKQTNQPTNQPTNQQTNKQTFFDFAGQEAPDRDLPLSARVVGSCFPRISTQPLGNIEQTRSPKQSWIFGRPGFEYDKSGMP